MKVLKLFIITILIFSVFFGCDSKNKQSNQNTVKEVIEEKEKPYEYPMVLVKDAGLKRGEKTINLDDYYIGKYELTTWDYYIVTNYRIERLYKEIKELEKTDFDKAKSLTNGLVKYNNNGDLIIKKLELPKKPTALYLEPFRFWGKEFLWEAAPYDKWKLTDICEFLNVFSEMQGFDKCYSFDDDYIICDFNKNGYRLPTDVEWICAYWGGTKSKNYKYSGSSNYLKVGWFHENSNYKIKQVGTKLPNELGIFDMSGNVWEACWEWKNPDNVKEISPGISKGYYEGSTQRGGAYNTIEPVSFNTSRYLFSRENVNSCNDLGVRLARSIKSINIKNHSPNIISLNRQFEDIESQILNSEKIDENKLLSTSKQDLRLLRNTIFAKYGSPFKSQDLIKFFSSKEWYRINNQYSDKLLTEIDNYNVELITKIEKQTKQKE
jgi:hypothetical protein